MIDESAALQNDIGDTFTRAYAALQRASVTLGMDRIGTEYAPLETGLTLTTRSVMGVSLPEVHLAEKELRPYYGLSGTDRQMDEAMLCFEKVKRLTARLAEVDTGVYRLATAIKKTQRRANMLENVVIPRETDAIKFISGVLEEREREEFTRLKVIKRNRQG